MDERRKQRRRRVRKEIFVRDKFTCQACDWRPPIPDDYEWDGIEALTDGERSLTIDHIIEKALGGSSTRENFRAMCSDCNVKRSVHVGKLVRQAQDRGMTLAEAREHAATRLGYR